MKVIDNRHLNYNNQVQFGDLIITEDEKMYIFVYENDAENLPCHQIDIESFESVDSHAERKFNEFTIGTYLEIGGKVKEIIKNKNIVLDLRD